MGSRQIKPATPTVAGMQAGDHPSLSAMIYTWLHTAILNGTLAPGRVLRQEELAAQFKTSRVPLREALQSLQAEGLVVLRPRRGYAVTSLDAEQLLSLLQLRILIEAYAGYAGACRRTQADVKIVGAILQEMEKLPVRLNREATRLRWSTLNRQFHSAIFAPSRNEHLHQLSANISAKVDPYIMMEWATLQEQEESRADHRRLFQAFAAGDADLVGQLSRLHCERTAISFAGMLHKKGLMAEIPAAQVTDLGPALAMVPLPQAPSGSALRARRSAKVEAGRVGL